MIQALQCLRSVAGAVGFYGHHQPPLGRGGVDLDARSLEQPLSDPVDVFRARVDQDAAREYLARLDYDNFEVIVVDDCSTDNSYIGASSA